MSKDLFHLMRESEVATSEFLPTKSELKTNGVALARRIVYNGEHNLQELYTQALRLKEAITAIETELKANMPAEDFEAFGVKAKYVQGGQSLIYKEDEVYAELSRKLKDREALLKTAFKSDEPIYDSEGVEVPKVSVSYRKSYLKMDF